MNEYGDAVRQQIVITALENMFKGAYFSICTVKQCADITGSIIDENTLNLLTPLHCVHWSQMPKDLRQAVYKMVIDALTDTGFDLKLIDLKFNKKSNCFEEKKKVSFLRRI